MNDQNLTPITSTKKARELGSKGGSSKSPLKSISAKLRWLKQTGKINDEAMQTLHDMMISDEAASFEILKFILSMRGMANNIQERQIIARLLLDWQKIRHPKRQDNNIIIGNNVQVNQISKYEDEINNELEKIRTLEAELESKSDETIPVQADKLST